MIKAEINRKTLHELYIKQKLSLINVSKILNIPESRTKKLCEKYKIKIRPGTRKGIPHKKQGARLNLIGQQFGFLTVLEYCIVKKLWKCICSRDNNIVYVRTGHLRQGLKKSCGCLMEKNQEQHHLWKGCGRICNKKFRKIRYNANTRGIDFKITIEDMWNQFVEQKELCTLSGVKLEFFTDKINYTKTTASLDRIDSSKGYLKNNIHWVHKIINNMKYNYSLKHFLLLCKSISIYNRKQITYLIDEEDKQIVQPSRASNWGGYETLSLGQFNSYNARAIARKLPFKITIKDAWNQYLKQNQICPLTGAKLKIHRNTQYNARDKFAASLDRIDSSKGYLIDNIQWVYKDINKMKFKLMDIDLIKWSHLITDYQNTLI